MVQARQMLAGLLFGLALARGAEADCPTMGWDGALSGRCWLDFATDFAMSNPTTTTCPTALLPGHPSQLTLLVGWRAVHGIISRR
jgi:hypothetical protein